MKLLRLTPMMRTWDMPATLAFYTDVLGFICENYSEEASWASLVKDEIRVMFSGPNQHEDDQAPAFTGSLYFQCDDVDTIWMQLQDKVGICYPPENFEYGMREFGIYDNNGYLLQFGQELSNS